MKRASVFDRETGLILHSVAADCGEKDWTAMLEQITADGRGVVEGHHDHLSERVDLVTGAVVDYQPPQPDADHEWHAASRRWRKRAEVVERENRQLAARKRIAELEAAQHRPHRELALDPQNAEARRRLAELDAEISRLRATLASK